MTGFKRNAAVTALALLLVTLTSGCESFLDVNEDPNNPETVRLDLTLPGMLMAFGHEILGPTDTRYANMWGPSGWGPEWLQQFSDNRDRHTYSQFQWFEVQNQDTDAFWGSSYSDVMQEAKNIMSRAEESEQWEFYGIAEFIFAWNAALLVDAFGPVPFEEAFDIGNSNPVYDSEEHIYGRVFEMVDDAIAKMQQTGPNPPTTVDVVFNGNMSAWVRLANSVKARLHMRLAYAPGERSTGRAQAALTALAAGIQSPADAPTVHYAGGEGARQPWHNYNKEDEGNSGERNRSNAFFINSLKANSDPRLPILANPAQLECPAGTGYQREECTVATSIIYRGNVGGGVSEPDSAISAIGDFITADDADFVWFTYEDTKFLEAEARLVASGAAAAEAPYRAAIRANMVRLGVASGAIDAYLAAKPSLASAANPLKELIWEKYVSNFLRDEVWHDYRRTGYPEVPLPQPPAGERLYIPEIPKRLRTPLAEMLFNSQSLAATGIPTGLDGMLRKVWWAPGN
jgi:hypothetical protein